MKSLAADVLGITDPSNVNRSLAEAYLTVMGEPFNLVRNNYLAAHVSPDQLSQTDRESLSVVRGVMQIVGDRKLTSSNTLTDWPTYQRMMRQYGTRADGTASALMIGSLNPLSSRAFVRLAQQEYGATRAYIVDPVTGRHKARHGTFVRASGLELPFRDGSLGFVHTSQLLHVLEDPSAPERSFRQKARLLLSEVARVLAPGGQVLMKEALPGHDPSWSEGRYLDEMVRFGLFIATALRQSGLDAVNGDSVEPPVGVDFLFDPQRNFDRHPAGHELGRLAVFGRKRPQSVYAL